MTHYDVLEVVPTASTEVITAAYRAKAKRLHPDVFPPEKKAWAEAQMKILNEVYHVLSTPTSGAEYDSQLPFTQQNRSSTDNRRASYQPPSASLSCSEGFDSLRRNSA